MGVALGCLWELFGKLFGHLGTTWAPFGDSLGCLWVLVGCLFQHFSLLLGASGDSGAPFCLFVGHLGTFGVIQGHFGRILEVFRSYFSGIP